MKRFEAPELEICSCEIQDVISTSGWDTERDEP